MSPTIRQSLPPNHFLSLPPTHSHLLHPTTLSVHSRGLAPNTSSTAAADFDVDVRTGFLPPLPPVERLEGEFGRWEEALEAAVGEGVGEGLRLGGGVKESAWRLGVDEMPTLSIQPLITSLPHLRRAHLVLTFLLHFYVHSHPSSPTPRTTPLPIPASISVPLLTVSPLLGLPPILTYSDTVLYNSHPADSLHPPSPRNPLTRSLVTFTNTPDEAHFYLTSARCELVGVRALELMRKSMDEAFMADSLALTRLTAYLRQLAVQIDLIGQAIYSVKDGCRPDVFYHLIRPWFKGGDGDGPASLGWDFLGLGEEDGQVGREGESNRLGKGRMFSGPSAGQSTLIHALDVFLMVDHTAPAEPSTSTTSETPPANESTFMTRMLLYMPAPHRSFLQHLSAAPHPIRSLVLAHAATRPGLVQAYDEALSALRRLREGHMRIVSLYIIQQARRAVTEEVVAMGAPSGEVVVGGGEGAKKGLEKGSLSEFIEEEEKGEELRGTGGTALIRFLKGCRDNTVRTMVGTAA